MSTTDIYTLSLHDALPIFYDRTKVSAAGGEAAFNQLPQGSIELDRVLGIAAQTSFRAVAVLPAILLLVDRKSTRLNSSHLGISYAVFCLKKKNKHSTHTCR